MSVTSVPSRSFPQANRRRLVLLLVVSLALARASSYSQLSTVNDVITLKSWREARRRRFSDQRRREKETPLNTPALEKVMTDLYIPGPSGTRTLLVPHRGRVSKVRVTPTSPETYSAHRKLFPPLLLGEKVGVNGRFWQMLRSILKIAIPGKTSKEAFLLVLHTFFLVARTYLSVLVARLDGRIVRDLVTANGPGFIRGLGWWFVLALPNTYTNSMHKLALAFRTNLTRYIHDIYLNKNLNYYKFGLGLGAASAVVTDPKAETKDSGKKKLKGKTDNASADTSGGADQLITTDLARFCDTLAALYGNMGKPVLDMLIFTAQLASSLGPVGTTGLVGQYYITAWILKKATPAFGRMAATEARLEGEYRTDLGRIGRDSEEIAFYDGGKREYGILWTAYQKLARHVHSVYKVRILHGMTEDFVIKYFWSVLGYGLMSIPVFFPVARHVMQHDPSTTKADVHEEVAARTESYVSNRRHLMALGDAGGRLMHSGKDLAELSGYTSRVYSLIASLHALDNNVYPKNIRPVSLPPNQPFYDMSNVHGRVIIGPDHVLLKGVPIVAPAGGAAGAERGGEELIRSLDLRVEKGEHTLITGPNGVGKTAIARVIGQLWPTWAGGMERPIHGEGGIFFLPQKPYLCIGSLRDQVIYPDSYADMKSRGRTDAELMNILKHVHLSYLPSREGGWETRKEWKDVLSGGEKQRMGMARLFYHRPTYGVLDESTSAVSTDVEGLMYEHAKSLGITLITISHRPSLLKYHNRHLRLGEPMLAPSLSMANLQGALGTPSTPLASQGWQLTKLASSNKEENLELEKEIERLEHVLGDQVGGWEQRLAEVTKELKGEA